MADKLVVNVKTGKKVILEDRDYDARQPTPEQELQEKRKGMVVTPWQFRKAINQLGRRGNVNSILVQADQDTKDGWEVATQFERLNPLITAFGTQLWPDDTDAELDALFELAATL